MLHVTPLKDDKKADFCRLFKDYYTELDCADDVEHLIEEYIIPDLLAGLLKIDMLYDNGSAAGFVIYQTDDINNEWNFKEGWGDVREIYIAPERRKHGLGKFLLYSAEMKLKESGADKAYCLPYAPAAPFFKACGYEESEEYNPDLDCSVFVKNGLDNCCHSK